MSSQPTAAYCPSAFQVYIHLTGGTQESVLEGSNETSPFPEVCIKHLVSVIHKRLNREIQRLPDISLLVQLASSDPLPPASGEQLEPLEPVKDRKARASEDRRTIRRTGILSLQAHVASPTLQTDLCLNTLVY